MPERQKEEEEEVEEEDTLANEIAVTFYIAIILLQSIC